MSTKGGSSTDKDGHFFKKDTDANWIVIWKN